MGLIFNKKFVKKYNLWDRKQYKFILFTIDKVNYCRAEKKKEKKEKEEENMEKKKVNVQTKRSHRFSQSLYHRSDIHEPRLKAKPMHLGVRSIIPCK